MNIHQFNMQFAPEEDRILFKMKTVAKEEFRFYFTRRFVKLLCPILVQLLEDDYKRRSPENPHAVKNLVEFEHDNVISGADFNQKYSDEVKDFPIGKNFILLTGITVKQGPAGNILCFFSSNGKGIEFQLNTTFLHIFCELLKNAVIKADWDIEIMFAETMKKGGQPPARVLH